MFIKLGIWKKIFFPDRIPRPDEYVFGVSQMNQITYEKLVEIYPIDPEIGHRNNELLILEILILKRLLLEMSPSKTLIFGNKIFITSNSFSRFTNLVIFFRDLEIIS